VVCLDQRTTLGDVESETHAPLPGEPPEPRFARLRRSFARAQSLASRFEPLLSRVGPWVSLLFSAVGAAYMDRSEEQGRLIVGSAAAGFVALVVLGIAHKPRAVEQPASRPRVQVAMRFASAASSQSLVQTCLFFSGPFYLQASAFTPAQCVFLAVFALAALISAWDPWCVRALLHPLLGPALAAFASFVAWNAALPMLGMPHRRAMWLAAALVSALIPFVYLLRERDHPRRFWLGMSGALLPLFLAAFGVRALPAAPLKVVDIGIGTGISERTLVGRAARLEQSPGKLWCYSAIFAPRGLKDDLVHAWSLDGRELTHIALAVRGGRKLGFRTWSYLPVPRGARGEYQCQVRTQFGQTLGVGAVRIGRH
jgi:hypothetical protein